MLNSLQQTKCITRPTPATISRKLKTMIRLTENDWRIFRRLQRKHKVSTEFLRYNLENIEKFIWFETWPRIVIKRYAVRKENRVFIIYYRLRRVLFDQSNRKMFKRMRQNIKQWSKRIVAWQKTHLGIKEYVEEVVYEEVSERQKKEETVKAASAEQTSSGSSEDVSKQLKQQLELLKNGRRHQPLITSNSQPIETATNEESENDEEINKVEKQKSDRNSVDDVRKKLKEQLDSLKARRDGTNSSLDIMKSNATSDREEPLDDSATIETSRDWQINLESTPEKQITTQENIQPVKQLDTDEKTEKSHTEISTQQTGKLVKTGLNFLDMLMCKVSGSSINTTTQTSNSSAIKAKESLARMPSCSSLKEGYQHHHEHSMDSTDEFLGFDDCERIPGMLMTPIVPHSTKNNKNSAFVSESLNEYMRVNDLETNYSIDEDKSVIKSKIYARDMEGLMTPKTIPPPFDMPAVPDNLLKFRTVAERKQYLQKFSKNYRLAIINNEASIYRELQRRMRTQKVKSASQIVAQSTNSSMSFTRNGWNAASFINTEFNKYYYQILDVDHGSYKVRLRGARGNNEEFHKTPYVSRAIKPPKECPEHCADDRVWQYLKPIKTVAEKTKKLNKDPLPAVFKPCPLSHKTFQKPLDDDTAALLLAGGSMAVVRMPTVELEVFPEYGKPLHEIAKRYLQYILPHHDISREWAEFSVSTLQQPKSLKEVEQAAAKTFTTPDLRKSYTFVIPYLNDRNHILVRRVVDRSEKLDQSFEKCLEDRELVPKTDFSFRQNLDQTDDVLLECADVVSDMINTVAISCSENSFIKTDPDGVNNGEAVNSLRKTNNKPDSNHFERPATVASAAAVAGNMKKHKKQNSLLLELKRLNATIIDAAVKPGNDKKPCSKEYCQMGCICVSLEETAPMREHCGKTKCMLECTCKSTAQSRIMRLETDGRTLTTEDAFMLRRKATARLARMEKEFTSTVVLTENETLLINETNNDKKRRCTKTPKRYEDFTDTEDEQRRNSPKKAALTTIDNEKHLAIEIKEVHEPVYVKDSILEQLKHCTVNLVPLQEMDNIAPWCMVHNLYKCFCKGRAVEGKPMIIEKEEVNTTIEHEAEQKLEYDYNVSFKAKYTFEKVEKKKKKVENNSEAEEEEDMAAETVDNDEQQKDNSDDNVKDNEEDWIKERKRRKREKLVEKATAEEISQEKQKSDEDVADELGEDEYLNDSSIKSGRIEKKSRRSLHEVRKRFYETREDSCRRHIPTPRRMFLYCNRRRRLSILKFIKENENEQTRLLLNEHVMRSVYYHKIDAENHKKNNSVDEYNLKEQNDDGVVNEVVVEQQPRPANEILATSDKTQKKFLLVNEVVDLLEDDEELPSSSSALLKDRDENTQLTSSSTRSCSSFEKITPDSETTESTKHFQICSSGGVITVKKCANLTAEKTKEQDKPIQPAPKAIALNETSAATDTGSLEALKLPKISSCFSLNIKANTQKPTSTAKLNEEQSLDFTSATSVHSAAFAQAQNQQTANASNALLGPNTTAKESGTAFTLDMDNENVRDVYNSVIKTMNSLVSKKMQDIDCALQRESHIIPTPNPDILCIMKWCNFLDAFCEGFAYVWQVKMKDDTFFVVTIRNMMPLIVGAMGIVNITALKPDKMPLMGKMLLQKFRNKETEKLAVVMQGKDSHWVVKGFLKSDPTMACNKPTPETHPSLTKKINVLCSLLVKQRQKEQKKKEKVTNQWSSTSSQMKATKITKPTATAVTQQPQIAPKIAQIMPTRRITTVQHTPPTTAATPQQLLNQNTTLLTQLQQQPKPITPQILTPEQVPAQNSIDLTPKANKQNDIEPGKIIAKINSRKRKVDMAQSNNLLKMDSYSKMSSNIEFRSVTQSDLNEIFLPELHKLDHKWLVLDLHNDFSHIFVPDFRDLVSLDRIQKVINFARQKSKIVKLQFFQNAPFDAFVTPKSGRKIYFGPLTMDMKSPTLILLQSVDGQMMLRELYQLQHNIVKKPEEKTKAFWLIHLKGKTQFEMNVNINGVINTNAAEPLLSNATGTTISLQTNDVNKEIIATTAKTANNINQEVNPNTEEEDDEDCMIIEDDSEQNIESIPSMVRNSSRIDNLNSLTAQINNITAGPAIQSIVTSQAVSMDTPLHATSTQSLLKVPNTNTIIKPLNPTNTSAPVVINVPAMSATNKPLPILTLPPNTIITGITPATPPTLEVTPTTPIINLPTNAVITGIKTAPPEAPYSSTIFITSSSPSTPAATTIVTTASTNTINNPTTTVSTTLTSQANEFNNKKTMNITRQSLEAGAIKRRRISLFCSNKYDKMSENLAVDAVIKKILPENAEDIQINPLSVSEEITTPPMLTPEVVTTVGSTKISKLRHIETNALQQAMETNTTATPNTSTTAAKPKAPIVFDVNFMDDGDEPTASILIKPSKSAAAATETTNTTTLPITNNKTVTNTTNSLIRQQLMSTTVSPTNLSTVPVYKNIKLPTRFNTTTIAVTNSTNTVTISNKRTLNSPATGSIKRTSNSPPVTVSNKRTLINSMLCTKQPDIIPTFSTPRPIAPKTNNTSCSPTDDNSNPFPFRRSSVSLKVQKIISSSAAATQTSAKPLSTSAIVSTNQPTSASPSTLTVQQVQEMLNKPAISVTSNKTPIASPAASPTMPLQILPAIKATITPANSNAISLTSTIITPASSPISITPSSTCTVSSSTTSTAIKTVTTPSSTETTSLNPTNTLTITKVQSFGSPQKPHNSDKNSPTFTNTPKSIVINDLNDDVPTVPSPPSHIQYGYIVSATHCNQKFVAKRVADEFYVKVPSVGILKLQGLTAVNNYLNKYISKTGKDGQNAAAVWQFVAASKAVQMQNHQKIAACT
ncbi:LOW QUALITY PROTEIN: uncharacterized protein LOC119601958 [Lucilia sericata]|uniref:LOW QUALITY PROTEIN: uncharacterized protein LOC119601958 n=1 Tax=Lucilia sericata TaxID=13632 RepID=UPI0018A87871|nr:LOW QUALITY PROTEIN: uncharacterized protein LOC119601958 [Lucilia sericata]